MILKRYSIINESNNESVYKTNNMVRELCVALTVLNNEFLDNLLDRGKRVRYTENTDVFVNDLKNLVISKNRLSLGKFVNNKCIEDTEESKLTKLFESVQFKIEDDFKILEDARITARNIIDKILPDGKLTNDLIERIYWLGPNQTDDYEEDLVLELKDGRQFSLHLNKNVTLYKTAAFSKFANELIGNEFERLFSPLYIDKWNELIRKWVEIVYTNANKNMQNHIEKFIDPSKIPNLHYFLYFDLKHRDPRFKNLGEYIKELEDNFLDFSHLMAAIWKNRDVCFADPEKVYNQWMEVKILILNSKILEHLLTESLLKNSSGDIEKLEDGFKLAKGKVKMKMVKTIVQKLGCNDRNTYYMGNNGNIFNFIPTIKFFREAYNYLKIKFDYHVELTIKKEERKNDFQIKIIMELDDKLLMDCEVGVNFGRTEVSPHLSARYKFGMVNEFNEIICNKMIKPKENYKEENSTVTHEGKEYDINKLLEISKDKETIYLKTSDLNWILKDTELSEDRIEKSDIKYPLIVIKENDKYITLDGVHRLSKAVSNNIDKLPVKIINEEELNNSEI